jgi:hypothetical protein
MLRRLVRILLAVALAALLAPLSGCDCGGGTRVGRCSTSRDCGGGERCVDGRCVPGVDAGAGDVDATPAQDAGSGDRDAWSPGFDAGTCRDLTAESTLERAAVDIIVVIDNSGSMSGEAAEVRRNINRFAEIIGASGLDYRVVLISTPTGDRGVCVPPPLGSGPPDCTSGPAGLLRAVHVAVGSTNGPQIALMRYAEYRDFLRMEAVKVFLWITDDESAMASDAIRSGLAALEPMGMFDRTIHNAIVGYYGETPETWGIRGAGSCPTLARPGIRYLRLANCLRDDGSSIDGCTPGRTARVCETDWTRIFEEIARGVVAGVPVPCEFDIPEPPAGRTLDYDAVRLTYSAGDGTRTPLERTTSAACTERGWYFDDPAAPMRIVLCPDVCRVVQADEGARIDIGLGCFPDLE